MNKLFIILLCIPVLSFSQIKKKDLKGDWQTNICDSIFFTNDTIMFYIKMNPYMPKCCHYFKWKYKGYNRFLVKEISSCNHLGNTNYQLLKRKVVLRQKQFIDVLTLKNEFLTTYHIELIQAKLSGLPDKTIMVLTRIE